MNVFLGIVLFIVWVGILTLDFDDTYVAEKGILGGWSITPFSITRDGIVILLIIYGVYECTQGFHEILFIILGLVSPWIIKVTYKIIKEILR